MDKEIVIKIDTDELREIIRGILKSEGVPISNKSDVGDTPICDLDSRLSTRAYNSLCHIFNGSTLRPTLNKISMYSEKDLLRFSNIGQSTVYEISQFLKSYGFKLADNE